MKCVICGNEVGMAAIHLGGYKVHLHCFFDESIPDPAEQTDKDGREKEAVRREAIDKRAKYIIDLANSNEENQK